MNNASVHINWLPDVSTWATAVKTFFPFKKNTKKNLISPIVTFNQNYAQKFSNSLLIVIRLMSPSILEV